MRIRLSLVVSIVLIAFFAMAQQSTPQPQVVNASSAKMVSVAGAPECASFSVEHGDPKGASSVTLLKLAEGCTVPMHWHSANEQVMFISGAGQLEMKGEQSRTLAAGDYIFMPAHHQHQLTCPAGCTLHRVQDGPVDIHYVDSEGNEIPAEKALAAFNERPTAAAVAKK